MKTRNGETLAFSILANDFVIPAATVNWIADLAVEILAELQPLSPLEACNPVTNSCSAVNALQCVVRPLWPRMTA